VSRNSFSDYNDHTTASCERALVTLFGDIGPWSERIYLAGGLAPRYLIGQLPDDIPTHVGTADVDLIGQLQGIGSEQFRFTLRNASHRSPTKQLPGPVVAQRQSQGHRGAAVIFRWSSTR